MKTLYSLIVLFVFSSVGAVWAQEVSPKASKYYEILKKRPTPGYLYDRFYNTWLDTDTIEGLEKYLRVEVEKENSTGSRLILAFFFTKQGDNVKAIEQFRLALENDPGNAETLHQMAVVEARTLNFDAAIEHLEEASEAKPKPDVEREILQMLGKLYARNGDRDKAMEAWKRLLDRNPDDENLREDLIELQITEGMWAEALTTAKQLQEATKDPYKAVLRRLRIGDIHQRSGDREKALEEYSASLEKVGSGTWLEKEIYSQIEQVFRREDDITGLKEHYKKLLETYPKRIVLHRQYAELLAELGETDSALEAFEGILVLTPGDRQIREDYISMLGRLDKKEKAAKQLSELIKLHSADAELEIRRAELANGMDKKEEARQALDAFIEKSDKSEYAYLRVARLLEGFKETDATDNIFKKLLEAFPESEGARDAYAAYLHRVDRKEDAVGIWKGMAEGGDRSQVVRIARGLASRGENAAAMELLESRYGDFSADPVYLQQLVTQALHLKRHDEALPWAHQLVRLAKNPLDLETAVDLAVKTVRAAEKSDAWIQQLKEAQLPQEKCLLAELLEQIGDSDQATAVLKTIEESEPLLATTQLIRLQRQRGDWDAAAKAAVQLAEMPGGRRSANVQKVVELYQRGINFEEALKWIPEWKKLSPGSTQPWMTEMRLLLDQGKSKEAIATMRRAMQEFEGNEDVRAALAQLYADEGQLADSSRIYMQLYEEAKDVSTKIRWVGMLAQAMELRGKGQTLVERFEERRRNNRNSIVPLLALAEIHRASNNYEERRKAMMEAARIKSDDLDLLHEIARIEASEEDYERALATLKTALPLDKTNKTRERMARLHFNNGNEEEGFAILREIAGGDNIDAKAAENLGQAIVASRNFEKGADFLLSFLEKFPGNYRLLYLHCICMEEAGREMEAARAFARITRINQELPNHQKSPTTSLQSVRNPYQDELRKLLPAAAFDLINIVQHQYQAYSYRNNSRTWSSGGYVAAGMVSLPPDLESAHFAALGHLMTIGGQLSEQERQELATDLKLAGFKDAELYLDLDIQVLNQGRFGSILESHPDNETIRALAILYAQNQVSLEVAELDRLCRSFEKTRPQLAASGALSAVLLQSDEELVATLLEWGVEKTLEIKNPGYFLANAIIRCLNQSKETEILTAEIRSKLGEHLLEIYEQSGRNGPWRANLFSSVAATLANEEDYTPLIAFLDSEIDHYHQSLKEGKSTNPGANLHLMGRWNNRSQILKPLVFPNVTLEKFPPYIAGTLQNRNNNNMFFGRIRFDHEQLQATLDSVRSPYLKLFLATICEADDVVKNIVASLVRGKEPDLDAYLMNAAYTATVGEDLQGAVKLLQKAQFLPMTRELRKNIDGSLVAWVLEELETHEAKEIAELVEAGKAAALRLRRVRLEPNQRTELAGALEELGLGKEAEKLAAQAVAPAASRSNLFSSAVQPSSGNRIEKLMAKGKKTEALRLLEGDLRRFATQGLAPQSAFNSNWEIREWSQLVAETGLRKELVEKIQTGETSNARRLAQYAFGLEILGEEDKAIDTYRKALALRERDDGVRLRLLRLLMAKEESAESMELLRGLDTRQIATLGPQMQNLIYQDEIPAEQRLRMVDRITDFVGALQDTENVNLSWLDNLVTFVAQMTYDNANNLRIDSLYSLYSDDNNDQDEGYVVRQKRLIDQRRKTYENLCETMLGIPQCARQGFYRISGVRIREGAKEEDLVELAANAVKIHKPAKSQRMHGMAVFGRSYNRDQNTIRMWYPEQFMIRAAWRRGDQKSVEENLLKPIRESKDRNLRLNGKTLEIYSNLYFCEEDEFAETVEEYLRKNNNNHMGDYGLWEDIVEVWTERNLETDLSALVLKHMDKNATGHNWGNQPVFLSKYCRKLLDAKGQDALTDFLVRMTTTCLKVEPSKWSERIKKEYSPRSISGGSVNAQIHQYFGSLAAAGNDEKTYWSVLDFHEKHLREALGAMANSGRFNSQGHILLRYQSVYLDFDTGVSLLKNTPFLNPVESFRSHSYSNGSNQSSILQSMGYRMRSALEDRRRKELRKKYETFFEETGTFGAGILAIQLENKDRDKKLASYLFEHSAAIDAAPEAVQKDLSAFASIEIGDNAVRKLSGEEEAFLNKLKELTKDDIDTEIADVMNAKKLSDLKVEEYRLDDNLQRYLKHLLEEKTDQVAAKALLEKVSALVDKARRRGLWSRNYQNSSFEAYVLNNLMSRNRTLPVLVFVLEQVEDPANTKRNYSYPQSYDQEYAFRHLVNSLPKGPKDESTEDRQKRQLLSVIDTLREQIDPKYIPALAGGLNGILRSYSGDVVKQSKELAEYLGEKPDTDEQPYARAMEMWFRMYLLTNVSKQEKGEKQSVNKYFQDILEDEKTSISGRTVLASELLRYYQKGLSDDTRAKCLDRLEDAVQAKSRVLEQTLVYFLDPITNVKKEDRDDAWRKEAARVLKLVGTHVLRPKPSGSRSRNNSSITQGLLALSLDLEDGEMLNQVLRHTKTDIRASWIAMMVASGNDDAARRLLAKHWQNLDWRINSTDLKYNQKLHVSIEPFCESMENEDLRVFTRAMLGSAKNESTRRSGDDKEPGYPSRKERLTDLAKSLKTEPFASVVTEEAILSFIAEEPEAAGLLKERFNLLGQNMSPTSLEQLNNPYRKIQKTKIYQTYLGHQLLESTDTFYESLQELGRLKFRSSYQREEAANGMASILEKAFNAGFNTWDEPTRNRNLKLWRDMLSMENAAQLFDDSLGNWTAYAIAAHAVAGQSEGLHKVWGSMNSEVGRRVERRPYYFPRKLLETLNALVPKPKELDSEKRLEIFETVYADPFAVSLYQLDGSEDNRPAQRAQRIFEEYRQANWITSDEILEYGPKWIGMNHRMGFAAWELVQAQLRKKDLEAAITTYKAGIEACGEDAQAPYSGLVLGLTRDLHQLKRRDEALAVIEGADRERIHPNGRDEYKYYLRESQLWKLAKGTPATDFLKQAGKPFYDKGDGLDSWIELAQGARALGRRYLEEDNPEEAETVLELASVLFAKINPGNAFQFTKHTDELVEARHASGKWPTETKLIEKGSEWRYFDQGRLPAENWMAKDYDDSGWVSGAAELGYGDDDENTVLSFGPDKNNKYVTAYFRKTFDVPENTDIQRLFLHIKRDDGSVIYVNGTEILRGNMPDGEIGYATSAERTVSSTEERNGLGHSLKSADIVTRTAIQPGKNVIAVEIHQHAKTDSEGNQTVTSSDCSFDLSLSANAYSRSDITPKELREGLAERLGELHEILPPPVQKYLAEELGE